MIFDINVGNNLNQQEETTGRLHDLMDKVSSRYDSEGKRL